MSKERIKTVIVLTGATATGKTATAIKLAQHFNTEIISADSRQCYRELKIGVARPSESELNTAPHHFIASHSITDIVTAVTFDEYAAEVCNRIFQTKDVVIMAGGTGLYLKAFCEGLDAIPPIEDEVRNRVRRYYEEKGLAWLQSAIEENDPLYAASGETANPQRMMRALEVALSTGKSIVSFRNNEKTLKDFRIIKTGLQIPREDLVRNINSRVDGMIEQGLLEEAKDLIPYKNLNALQTVGYSEMFGYLNSILSFNEAVERIKINTRQYAKRQQTWFKKDAAIQWFHPDEYDALLQHIESKLT